MNLKFIILGCGSSLGVPRIDGNYGDCDPKNPKNFRTRCCALIKSKNKKGSWIRKNESKIND